MSDGWIKLNRRLLQSLCFQNRELLQLWVWLLLSVNHAGAKVLIGNQVVDVKPGQLVTGRNKISTALNLNSSKIERLLNVLEIEHQIEQQTFTKYRIISISKWDKYQTSEHQIEQQMNSKRTADEHKQEGKEVKKKNMYSEKFNDIWQRYPNRDGKKKSYSHFISTVKNDEDWEQINLALDNYLANLKRETWKSPKNGSTWFNNWQDWKVQPTTRIPDIPTPYDEAWDKEMVARRDAEARSQEVNNGL